jgi:hypothetical protein
MDLSKKMFRRLLVLTVAFTSGSALAAIQMHSFTVSGDNGETGSGFFTYDDETVLDGESIGDLESTGDLLSLELRISGGNVEGGQTVFTLSDCFGAILQDAPDFNLDINFWCDNGPNGLEGVEVFTNVLNDNASVLTFVPGTTSPFTPIQPYTPVPALPMGALAILAGLAGLFGARKLRKAA